MTARYRLAPEDGRYHWTRDGAEVASVAWRDHCWDVLDHSGRAAVSVVRGPAGRPARVALVDHRGRRVATLTLADPVTRAEVATVTDSVGEPLARVRADGPTGLHLVDPAGEVLALSSRRRGATGGGCDVLLTAAGDGDLRDLLLGVVLTLELVRTGALRPGSGP